MSFNVKDELRFVETRIFTKFGTFNIRVYNAVQGKEPFALWTDKTDFSLPVLLRVHSECLTGDMLGSLHCDCGQQLKKTLKILNEQGGLLIYLRQEGRGIGLFEKIKTYLLQRQGLDTFDANVALGHRPDARTYEMVKTVLDDLNVSRVRLLTNNPYKISEIAKLGVEVVERVPIVFGANQFNKKYFIAKSKKFQHFLHEEQHHYSYQFHAETLDQIVAIGKFIHGKKKDPLLKIYVGVTMDHITLKNEAKVSHIKAVFEACNEQGFVPSLHYSFRHSDNAINDLDMIHKMLPCVSHIQLNDVPLDVKIIMRACALFHVDIPLSDDNFGIVQNPKVRSLIKKHGARVLLDNSKGKGIQESTEALMQKINILLAYNLNDIGLCGGFGPEALNRYFELRRFYRINFSIDAETKLKTDEKVDVQKIQLYLLQLLRFNDPKYEQIKQAKKFLKEHRISNWDQINVHGYDFVIHPKVFHAGHFPSTSWFATELCKLLKDDSSFCEVGCGAGVISCLVALSNPKIQVTATDISPYASKNAVMNAQRHGLLVRISVFTGDVLDSINQNERFDAIFWAPPFVFLDPGTSINLDDAQVFDPGYRAIRKFLQTARKYLSQKGRLFLGFSTDLGHYELLESLAQEVQASIKVITKTTIHEEVDLQFEILEFVYEGQ